MMSAAVLLIWWPRRRRTTPFHWSWAIPFISLFLSAADLCYLYALSDSEAMISVVSMIRRGSVVVSFGFGALLFRERNLRAKAIDSGVDPRRYGLPLDRFAVERRSRRASQCVREAGASGCAA